MFEVALAANKKLGNNELCRSSGLVRSSQGTISREKLAYVRSEHSCKHCRQNKTLTEIIVADPIGNRWK